MTLRGRRLEGRERGKMSARIEAREDRTREDRFDLPPLLRPLTQATERHAVHTEAMTFLFAGTCEIGIYFIRGI